MHKGERTANTEFMVPSECSVDFAKSHRAVSIEARHNYIRLYAQMGSIMPPSDSAGKAREAERESLRR